MPKTIFFKCFFSGLRVFVCLYFCEWAFVWVYVCVYVKCVRGREKKRVSMCLVCKMLDTLNFRRK